MNNGTVNQRIRELVKTKSKSMNDFAQRIGVSQPTISKIINGKSEPQYSTLKSIIETFGIDPTWLLVGSESKEYPSPGGLAYASDAEIGYMTARKMDDAELMSEAEVKKAIGPNHTIRRFRVTGDSMEPNLRNGDILYCTNEGFKEFHVHVIETTYGTIVKRLKREARPYYVAMSDNQSFSTFKINPEDIRNIWFAKAKLSYNLSGHGDDLNTRLTHIEQILSTLRK